METTVNEPKGITMHTETLRMCVVDLSKEEKGGVLESILHDYFPNEFHEDTDRTVRVVSNILRDNIARNNEKYTTRKAKNAEYWEKYNRERKEREANKILQELQKLQGVVIPDNALQSLTNIGLDNKSKDNKSKDNKSKSKPQPKSQPQSNPQSNEVDNTSISNNENINKNSLSQVIYQPEEVEKLLKEKEIFFKPSEFQKFYLLNEAQYKWKYEPYVAALTYIERHPNSLKKAAKGGVENAPQYAAPPNLDQVRTEINVQMKQTADGVWIGQAGKKGIRSELFDVCPAEEAPLIWLLSPQLYEMRGYSNYSLTLCLRDNGRRIAEQDDVEKFDRARTLIRTHMDVFKSHRITEVKLV